MKTTVTQAVPIEPRPLTYPILMQNKHYHEMVVLFVSAKKGILLAGIDSRTYQMETEWEDASNDNIWRPFAGAVMFQNDLEQLL